MSAAGSIAAAARHWRLISSGQYVAGAVWPPMFERGIALFGWRQTMLVFAVIVALVVAPLALLILRAPPETPQPALASHADTHAAACSACRPGW